MGNPKQKWTEEEENALRAGIEKHGTGKWKNIQKDPEFNRFLYSRSNIDLKDKWRNMSVTINGQVPRDRARTLKPKGADFPATPMPISQVPGSSSVAIVPGSSSVATVPGSSSVAIVPGSSSVAIVPGSSSVAIVPGSSSVAIVPADPTPTDVIMEDSSKGSLDGKTAPKYNALIYEALSTLKDPNGSDTGAIASFIEQRQEVPPNFKRLLSGRLRRLAHQDKLEKVQQNCYRLRTEGRTSDPIPKPKEIRPKLSPKNSHLGETLEEAAVAAAYKVAEAENKSFVAAEAVKELERVTRMAEEAEAFLQLAQQIYERCATGEVVKVQ